MWYVLKNRTWLWFSVPGRSGPIPPSTFQNVSINEFFVFIGYLLWWGILMSSMPGGLNKSNHISIHKGEAVFTFTTSPWIKLTVSYLDWLTYCVICASVTCLRMSQYVSGFWCLSCEINDILLIHFTTDVLMQCVCHRIVFLTTVLCLARTSSGLSLMFLEPC